MLKIISALPVQFGPTERKKGLFGEIVPPSLPDYTPDPNDVRLPDLAETRRNGKFLRLSSLRAEWEQQGMVCIVKVARYEEAADARSDARWRQVDEFLVARFTKLHTAILFKLSLDF